MGTGGARPGAGRPRGSKSICKTALDPRYASMVWERIDRIEFWRKKLQSEDEAISLKAAIHLDNRENGNPAQAVNLNDSRSKVILRSPEKEIPCQTDAIQ